MLPVSLDCPFVIVPWFSLTFIYNYAFFFLFFIFERTKIYIYYHQTNAFAARIIIPQLYHPLSDQCFVTDMINYIYEFSRGSVLKAGKCMY